MKDLVIKSCKYIKGVFYVTIEKFDKLTKAPIKVINNKTKNEKIFTFVSETNFSKIFKCENLTLIVSNFKKIKI